MQDVNVYINAVAGISPQETFTANVFTQNIIKNTGNRFNCIEPDYDELIDAKLIRRMSRIIKMGTATAIKCLQHAHIKMPDAIIVGTAYGCLQDTETFLQRMIDYNEELLTPTAFIQSTHNTVGAQIALMLQCHNYNNTFVQNGFSFESALLDAMLLLKENEANNVLVGGADELTDTSFEILSRFGLYKQKDEDNDFYNYTSKGTAAGEGTFFFLLNNERTADSIAKLEAIEMFYDVAETEVAQRIVAFLDNNSLTMKDIDFVITGRNGDAANDTVYDKLDTTIFAGKKVINYKHLCGEYPTSTAFALWMAAVAMKEQILPFTLVKQQLQNVLIYNHYLNTYHSLLLVSAC